MAIKFPPYRNDVPLTDEDRERFEAACKADEANPHAFDWINDLPEAPSLDDEQSTTVIIVGPSTDEGTES